jgi:hypothetical protein
MKIRSCAFFYNVIRERQFALKNSYVPETVNRDLPLSRTEALPGQGCATVVHHSVHQIFRFLGDALQPNGQGCVDVTAPRATFDLQEAVDPTVHIASTTAGRRGAQHPVGAFVLPKPPTAIPPSQHSTGRRPPDQFDSGFASIQHGNVASEAI